MIKTNLGKAPLAYALAAAGILALSAHTLSAATATVRAVRGNPKYNGANGFPVIVKKGDVIPAGATLRTAGNESIDLTIEGDNRLVTLAPNSRLRLEEGPNAVFLEKGELVGSVRKVGGNVAAPLTFRTPSGVTQVSVGDLSLNADNGTHSLLSGNRATFQPISPQGAPSAPINLEAGSVATALPGAQPVVRTMSQDVTASLLARVDTLNNSDQSRFAAAKGGRTATATTTQASPEPEPGPGTGTPGYWMNHPEAWPINSITVGGVTYSITQAIQNMRNSSSKDVTYSMFQAVVAARLNALVGNQSGCITGALAGAESWLTANPLGSRVSGSSTAWTGSGGGEDIKDTLDAYNNGLLCAPSRD